MWINHFESGWEVSRQVELNRLIYAESFHQLPPCPSGFAAGSVVSPILFNIHANTLEDTVPSHLNVNAHKYADDCTEYQIVGKGKRSLIQCEWTDNNKVVLNLKKEREKKRKGGHEDLFYRLTFWTTPHSSWRWRNPKGKHLQTSRSMVSKWS